MRFGAVFQLAQPTLPTMVTCGSLFAAAKVLSEKVEHAEEWCVEIGFFVKTGGANGLVQAIAFSVQLPLRKNIFDVFSYN